MNIQLFIPFYRWPFFYNWQSASDFISPKTIKKYVSAKRKLCLLEIEEETWPPSSHKQTEMLLATAYITQCKPRRCFAVFRLLRLIMFLLFFPFQLIEFGLPVSLSPLPSPTAFHRTPSTQQLFQIWGLRHSAKSRKLPPSSSSELGTILC